MTEENPNPQSDTQSTDAAQAPTSGADAGAVTPPEAPQVAEQVAQNDPTDSPSQAPADQLASDGDAVREGVQEEGGQTNAD